MKKRILGIFLVIFLCTFAAWAQNQPRGSGNGSAPSVGIPGTKADGKIYFDGAMASLFATGVNSTATTPSFTTNNSNETVLAIYGILWGGVTVSTAPSGMTNREAIEDSSNFGIYVYDETVSSAGPISAISAGLSQSEPWLAAIVALVPSTGQTITFRSKADAQPSSGNTVTINLPSGTSNGDTEIACVGWYDSGGSSPMVIVEPPTQFPATSLIFVGSNASQPGRKMACWSHVASSEPSSYTWSFSTGNSLVGMILDYENVAGIDSAPLSSVSASFQSTDVGKLICTAGAGANNWFNHDSTNYYQAPFTPVDQCGTISKILTSTSVLTTFGNVNAPLASAEYRYATDDSGAIQTFLNGLPTGAYIQLPVANYGMSTGLTIPQNIAWRISGSAAGVPYTENNILNPNGDNGYVNTGTNLWFLTKSMTVPGLLISGRSGQGNMNATTVIENLGLYAGAGISWGSGSNNLNPYPGITVLNWQGLIVRNVYVSNFAGNCTYVDGITTGTSYDYIEHVSFEKCILQFCGGSGGQVGSGTAIGNISTVKYDGCTIEANQKSGMFYDGYTVNGGSNLQAPSFINNVVAWNNISGEENGTTGTIDEMRMNGSPFAGEFKGNYFELNTMAGSQSNSIFTNTWGWMLIDLSQNFYFPASATPHMLMTASGNYGNGLANAPCNAGGSGNLFSQLIHKAACVSDSTACTAGTTYTSGGSTLCRVECNGTNWVETGTTAGCN